MRHVTRWNRQGIAWRGMTAPELLWLYHTEQVEYLRSESPQKLRKYLVYTRDDETLIAWDASQMKERQSATKR